MRLLQLILFALLFVGCNHESLNVQTFNGYTLTDSVPSLGATFHERALESGRFLPIFYLGDKTENITLSRTPLFNQKSIQTDCYDDIIVDSPYLITHSRLADIEVTVGDNINLGQEVKYGHFDSSKTLVIDSLKIRKSLLLEIRNNSNNPFILCDIQKLILQTKRPDNTWRDIFIHETLCYLNEPRITIPKKNIIIAKYPCYHADTVAVCRIKAIGQNDSCYSNEFKYHIDKWKAELQ